MTQPSDNKSTYAGFAQAFADEDRGGRFKAVNQTIHTAATPVYPVQPPNSPFRRDPAGQEPPLGFSVDQMDPVGTAAEIEASLERLGEAGLPSGQPDGGDAQRGRTEVNLYSNAVSKTRASPPPTFTDDE
jgi:hypothetical protein